MAIEITVPRLGWSMNEGVFVAWLRKEGDLVHAGEPLFTLESEKTTQDIESLDSGILHIPAEAPKPGSTVKVGQGLGYFLAIDEPLPSQPPLTVPSVTTAADRSSTPPPLKPAKASSSVASPRARRIAAELGITWSALQGTGRGGRIRERDVRQAALGLSGDLEFPGRKLPITPLRRTIADRLARSRNQTVPVTLTCRADATHLVSVRRQFKASIGDTPAPSYTDIVVKLVAAALQEHPLLAARWEDEHIVLPTAIHIGIAVDTEYGLLVPVLRNVPSLTLLQVALRSTALIEAARSRRLRIDDLQGGTFTVTNLGAFGVEAFTPIINFPETAVLGVGAIRREAVVLDDGRLVSREQVALSLTFDHRILDGAPAARFLQHLREGIENCCYPLLGRA